jgi:cytochrome c-type biogenesis protein CcmH/NrfG
LTPKRWAVLLSGLVVLFFGVLAWRGWTLVSDGRPEFVLLGVGVLILPAVGAWLLIQEWRFGLAAERLARRLDAEGGLPVDDLPKRPSGRVERAAADAVFAARRAEVETAPDDWTCWYRLAVAYGDAGDTRRGRQAMRHAIRLYDRG